MDMYQGTALGYKSYNVKRNCRIINDNLRIYMEAQPHNVIMVIKGTALGN
jgi:hypothetical protein